MTHSATNSHSPVVGDYVERATYAPARFDVPSLEVAREVILTPHYGLSTNDRWQAETPLLLGLIKKYLAPAEDSLVLDYGCGIGRISKEMIDCFGCWVIGADISPSMQTIAVDYVSHSRFWVMHPTALPFVEGKLDHVLAIWVLQHCYPVQDDIDRIYRSLKPGGKLFVVNEIKRCVPAEETLWVDDSLNIRAMLGNTFKMEVEGKLDPSIVTDEHAYRTFCGIYRKD